MKNKVENGLDKIFDLWVQTIDMSDQAVFTINISGLHDEEGKKINISNLITKNQRRSCHFLSFVMTVHPDQAYPKIQSQPYDL